MLQILFQLGLQSFVVSVRAEHVALDLRGHLHIGRVERLAVGRLIDPLHEPLIERVGLG